MPAQRFRLSTMYAVFYKDRVTRLRFTVRKLENESLTPLDLTAYTSVRFRAFASDSATTLIANVSLTVLTSGADQIDGVSCRAEGNVTFTTVATAIRCQIDLETSGVYEVADAQWEADVVAGGATS